MSFPSTSPFATPSSQVQVAGVPHEYKILATAKVEPGERLFLVEGIETDRPSRYSIQTDDRVHIDVAPGSSHEDMVARYPWRFLNHCCTPNAMLRGRECVALQTIEAGDEVTYHYDTTEFDMAAPFECRCGAPDCLRSIRGFKHLPLDKQTPLSLWLADHLRRRLDAARQHTPA